MDQYRRPLAGVTINVVGDGVDELDLALLDALHVNPQASFEDLGRVLDVSPVTAHGVGGVWHPWGERGFPRRSGPECR